MGVGALTGASTDAGMQAASNVINGKDQNDIDYGSVALGASIGAIAGPVLGKVGKFAIGKCRNAFGPFRIGIGENHLIVDQEGFELITLFRGELLRLEMVDMLTKQEIPNCVNLISIFAIKDFFQVDYGGGHETLDISILKGKYIN